MESLPAGSLLIGHLAWVRGKRPVGLRALLPGIRHFILQIGMTKKKNKIFSGREREVSMTATPSGSGTRADNGTAICPGPP